MTQTLTFKGNTIAINFTGNLNFTNTSGSCYGQVQIFKDGSALSQIFEFGSSKTVSDSPEWVVELTYFDTPTAASHTYDIRWASKNGFTLLNIGTARQMQIVELG